ncbi:hypothetical protein [Novosphingobium sp.]|uniref:hypothetical protein n=1 Tax=Novosphingobium sp. TaxID=1874826 RepID=UPI0038BBB5A4
MAAPFWYAIGRPGGNPTDARHGSTNRSCISANDMVRDIVSIYHRPMLSCRGISTW